jgi:predicted RecB family nuclease
MRLSPSDFATLYRPNLCELRIWLKHQNQPQRDATAYEEVLSRLGERHETAHLKSLGQPTNMTGGTEDQYVKDTLAAIQAKIPVVHHPVFCVNHTIAGVELQVFGIPDFIILDVDNYIIRDAKLARRIDDDNHPEIMLQLQLYGWLFEKSTGFRAKSLQVINGKNEIIGIQDDGGAAALCELAKVLAIKQSKGEPYEPVGWSKCSPCTFNERCWNRAEKNNDVALLPPVDQGLARKLKDMNILTPAQMLAAFTVESLADLERPYGTKQQRVGKNAQSILHFAEAAVKGEERWLSAPKIPKAQNFVMFDLEGMPPYLDELDKIYLWGAQVFGEAPGDFMPALAGFGADGDRDSWIEFLKIAGSIFAKYGDIPFVHWAAYERTNINKYIKRFGDEKGIAARVLQNLIDLYTVTKQSAILPVASFSLKVIEQHVGYERKQAEFGGQWSMATFIEATETADQEQRQKLMQAILDYNKEDLEAMWAVFQWLRVKSDAS